MYIYIYIYIHIYIYTHIYIHTKKGGERDERTTCVRWCEITRRVTARNASTPCAPIFDLSPLFTFKKRLELYFPRFLF